MKWNIGEKNGNWKGGKTIMSSGYVGVRVPQGHHLRMNNGYAYEHQLVAEDKIGRRLRPGEIVHHINGMKSDNKPDNIEVLGSRWHHKVEHRVSGDERRKPGETNPMNTCACGCGQHLFKYDQSGRPRRYVEGHSWRKGKCSYIFKEVECSCGCGTKIVTPDGGGRPRRYVSGHNGRMK